MFKIFHFLEISLDNGAYVFYRAALHGVGVRNLTAGADQGAAGVQGTELVV